MKQIITHIVSIILLLTSINFYAQNEAVKGYRIDGDDVVFVFNKSDYNKISHDNFLKASKTVKDIDIKNVTVSGEFNDWSKNKWKMTKIDSNTYELRKKLADFTDEFSWEFKFVINNEYWAEPSEKDTNISSVVKNSMFLNVYNLKMHMAYSGKNGNATFKLNGYEDAKQIIVAGSFNKWDEDLFKMNKVDNGWELTLNIRPGVYEYRFIVDGNWMEDPNNIHKVRNEFDEYNSLLDIKEYTAFKLRGFTDAKKVILSGSFNNWDEQYFEMEKMDYGWKFVVPLSAGKHHYKFIIDGEWITDPNNSVKEYDGEGNVNSVCMVK